MEEDTGEKVPSGGEMACIGVCGGEWVFELCRSVVAIHVHTYIHVCVYMYVYMCIHTGGRVGVYRGVWWGVGVKAV